MRGKASTAVVVALVALSLAPPASAEGGKGASACSENGRPDGIVNLGDPSTHDNPGEVVSFLNPSDFHVHVGPQVSAACRPSRD